MRLIDFFDRAVAMHPGAVFLQQGTVARRYCEAHDNSHRIAAALQRSAVAERCPIGFYMPNDWRGIEALYGALRSGAPLAQVNARNSVKENATFLNDTSAGALFFHSKYAEEAEAVLSQCPLIELAVCLDGGHPRYPALAYSAAGFSFGSRIALRLGCSRVGMRRIIAVGIPTKSGTFEYLQNCLTPKVFVQSTQDEHGPRPQLEAIYRDVADPKQIHWVEAADHFFRDGLDALEDTIFQLKV